MLLFVLFCLASATLTNEPEYLIHNWDDRHLRAPGISAGFANRQGLQYAKTHNMSYSQIKFTQKTLPNITCTNKQVCQEFVIGHSLNGLPISGLRISNFTRTGLPKMGWQSTIHGNEVVGVDMLIRLAAELQTPQMHQWRNQMDIYIIPILNPDGYVRGSRGNARSMDLNRNFPDRLGLSTHPLQPETKAIMDWMLAKRYTLSATYHGGSLVVNYPYDCSDHHYSGTYAESPDDATFRMIASEYAKYHYRMRGSREFPGGITNGNAWYCITGSLQDWQYLQVGTMEVTIEVSNQKDPINQSRYFGENRQSMYAFMDLLNHKGIYGQTNHSVHLNGNRVSVEPNEQGWFYRLLAPGDYVVNADLQIRLPANQQKRQRIQI